MGFTHIELLPIRSIPSTAPGAISRSACLRQRSVSARPMIFAISSIAATRPSIGVIVDWVPAHFPQDEHGLAQFDGTALYEHADPAKAAHADWGTLIFNYGRREVVNYLIGSALCWIDEFHIDAIRVDAVASMLVPRLLARGR